MERRPCVSGGIMSKKRKKMFKKFLYSAVSLLLVVSVTGCSLFVSHNQTISINGQPANATVVVNGRLMTTPAVVKVPRNKGVNIVVTKDGYHSFMNYSGTTLSPWGILDIVGGVCFLVPFIGLAAPGAYELQQDNFYYMLTPVKK